MSEEFKFPAEKPAYGRSVVVEVSWYSHWPQVKKLQENEKVWSTSLVPRHSEKLSHKSETPDDNKGKLIRSDKFNQETKKVFGEKTNLKCIYSFWLQSSLLF